MTCENKGNLAIIGASYLQLPLIEKAKEMGYVAHVFAWEAGDVGESAADVFHPVSIVEKEEILDICRKLEICGICSIASDLAMLTVNYVASSLNLPSNSLGCTEKSTNKHAMRQAFEAAGDPSPKSILVENADDRRISSLTYPLIVKPIDRSGSRGITKLDDSNGLADAISAAASVSFENSVLVEEYAEGEEYSVEFISYHGKHYFLALTQKCTIGAPHFIECGHFEPASVSDGLLEKIKSVVEHALDTLEITEGASHSEIKIDDYENIKIIEIGGRMGGDLIGSDLVYLSTGVDYVKAVIQVACGIEPDLHSSIEPIAARSVFIFDEEDYKNYIHLRNTKPEAIIRVAFMDEDMLGKATDSSNRAGCFVMRGDTPWPLES